MIRFEHVTRRYEPGGRPALDDVTVEFNRGDFVFLIGASGSGKSTLLRMILREGLPQRGKVTVAGQNLGLMLERRVPDYRRSVGMVFQDFRLLPDKTVFDNVAFAMRVIGAKRSQIRERVTSVLERVGLEDLGRRYPHEISGGEQQRAAIARAMVNEPAILLADEPTGNLDPRASDEVMKILRWINASGTTVVMATHDRAIVDRMRRRVVQLHDGALVRDDERGSYDPPRGSHAWTILSEQETSGALRAHDPRPAPAPAAEPAPHTVTADAARSAGEDVPAVASFDSDSESTPEPGTTPEESPAPGEEGIHVSWPDHLRGPQAVVDVPEPTGEFDGAEMPDLDRDGYTEPESGLEPEGEGADPERLRDALRQAVSSHTQMSAGPEGAAEKPRLSWLSHAAGGEVDRQGSAATPAAPGSANDRRDEIEDARLRAQSSEDEPPIHEPDHPASRGQGPRRRLPVPPASPAESATAATPDEGEGPASSDPPSSEPAPPDPASVEPADRDVPEHVPDADRPASAVDAEGEEVADLPPEHHQSDAASPADDPIEHAPPGGSSPDVESPEVPKPRSSASQSTYTDTRRTAEQLGVTGEHRSIWRRLRRNR
ncbi:cell division ATP-binding protein FtsE [Nesterenkonia xinjiangensis]|uniref:Cell division ATP-binding protein FtsE n=1 Tax=Nesterenkonia xinjiangensis TaxID=225327 RepID=A0A7Z0GNK6_9MICC|nr:cell division ATP-binding protein FtsE [Nesterenkonia xinjiangensis]NYJ79195.1 cell division transport system ATP-binding protein [Nesterenkonia xinjiangensis]